MGHGRHLRRFILDTNPIEALNRQIRKIIKTRRSFPNEDSARKLLFLAITRAQRAQVAPRLQLELGADRLSHHFGDRLPDTAI
jgi:transposase-like protein